MTNGRDRIEVAIIGAGPFGLSIAAHVGALGVPYRIFGKSMDTWARQMPKGMLLKSDGHATNVYDPKGRLSYDKYCKDKGVPYADLGIPPTSESFIDYGRQFQKELVPHLEDRTVTSIESGTDGHVLKFADGGECHAHLVVVATGISYFGRIPEKLLPMHGPRLTHSSEHHDLSAFKGRKVIVIGAGASAADVSGLLHRIGADVHLVCRKLIAFGERMKLPRPLMDRIREPTTTIGPNWKSWFFVNLPLVFRKLPQAKRLRLTSTHLGASPGYFTREMVLGRVTLYPGYEPVAARDTGDGIELTLRNDGGEERRLQADHVICSTGYRPALSRLPFLGKELLSRIESFEDYPVLDSWFESSVPGLFFVGAPAAPTFGPLVRFACGAEFTAKRISRRLAKLARTKVAA
jgi:thioredoxin reductase